MKSSNRRIRRRASRDASGPKQENRKEQKFFGAENPEPFFQPAAIQRAEDPKQKEEEKLHRAPEEKKEEKLSRAPEEKKEKEKLSRAPEEEKKEEKVARAAEPKEKEEKLARVADPKEKEEKLNRAADPKEKEEKLHRKSVAGPSVEDGAADRYIRSINGKGAPLPESEQAFFGDRLGGDFSDVRVHTGGEAADSAKDVSAKAYTYGNHIVFNEGQYNPDSREGKHLLAHELTHVVQQGGAQTGVKAGGESQGKSGGQGEGKAGGVQGRAGRSVQRGFWDAVDWVGGKLSGGLSAVGHGIASVAGWGYDVFQSAGAWVWDFVTWMPSRIWSLLCHVGSGIVGIVSWLWRGLSGALGHIWDGLKGVFSWLGDGLEGLFGWIWRGLRGGGSWAWKLLHGDFSAFWTGIGDAFSWLGSGVAGFLEWEWHGLEGLVTWGWRGLRGLGAWLWDGILRGLPWIGRLLAKLLDLLGVGEMWTFLMNIIKGFSTRAMTPVEIAEAKKVYAGSLSYWQVRIDEMSLIAAVGAWFKGSSGMGVTTAQTINFNHAISAAPGNSDMAWLIHELGHVAQYTAVGLQYLGEAIHAQATGGYNYGGGSALAGKNLNDFNREQQADILRDYYAHVLYGASPYAAEYTRLRDQAVRGAF